MIWGYTGSVWIVCIIGLLIGQWSVWREVSIARVVLRKAERVEATLEKEAAKARVAIQTIQALRDAMGGPALTVRRLRDGIVLAVPASMHMMNSKGSHDDVECDQLSALLAGKCMGVSDLVVSVGAPIECDLVAAHMGCSVMSFDANPVVQSARVVSAALSEEGWRIAWQPSLAWNVTSDADYVLMHSGARYHVKHKDAVVAGTRERWSVPTTRLTDMVRQNVALLHVATPDWQPVLQGLRDFSFKLHAVWLSSHHGGDAFLQRFCETHGLAVVAKKSSVQRGLLMTAE